MNYRIKQFCWYITSSWKKIDTNLIRMYLNNNEEKLFKKLNNSEQHHCIRVCNDAIKKVNQENININKNKLAKIALLHDVGKTTKYLNVVDKSLIVLLDKFTKGKLKKYTNIKKIDVYYNHPIKGVRILKSIQNYDKEFLDVIKNHHKKPYENMKKEDNIYLKIIRECDNKN
ncbi:putative nucleotidyltransferase with HDIG domain [Clostridium moniliforme]|uniref:Nucleotidyltransferase with HDIG domain n=1 Tax=Clostridium moniliforme TaxID=39489 RepID=A0ABS4F3U2_9CLOT|nr:HD domain-containing protein [Clostridium moniliforme]MBP1890907.1 putative nucleotidyltransferase with HDIG domain [Clostridium moniliforme]